MKRSALLLVCMLLAGMVQGQSTKIKFEEYDLPNGLHVILHEDKTTPIVAVTVMYHVGSKNEQAGRTGFAHFFEHLLFEGTENVERGKFMGIVKEAGGALNANTNQDRTFYYQILPSNQLELGLYLESERLLHAKIDKQGVETQREVVKEEKRQRIDNVPYMTFQENIFKRAFKDHPYKWTPIGSMEDLNAAQLNEFMAFYKEYYVPNNAVLSIAGDINIAETKELINRYFGEIPKGKTPYRPKVEEPALTVQQKDTIYDNIQLPAVFQAYRMPGQGTPDYYALNMLTTLLSGGPSARMQKQLVEKDQKALQVVAFPYALEDHGLFITLGLVNMGVELSDLENSMNREIERAQQELISEQEFQKVFNQIESQFVTGNARIAGIAESLANYHMYYGDANLINTEIDRYRKVTREDIRRVAQQYLTPTNSVVLYYLPKSQQPANQTSN
ncbi:M16 family metallopeptidase [Cesiribacter andamanensis]|uniref:Protease 3 n=1 Tax=Cesiribacter andamanensis AMV16 TaxID=1279009 RepID=M7NSB3_9BACT|nr:pitrilysin family protein [Cesiribacter andamanensis]EMR01359.1 Protease 3 precursor [Cesiribacter andamanensis AMV16]